jgi:predicted nucleic acid-binding protein
MNRVLVDTGPLVASLSEEDQHHEICVAALKELSTPLLTCWPVITEAAWLLRNDPEAVDRLLQSVSKGFLQVLPVIGGEADKIAKLLSRYRNLRPQIADAMLVYLAHRENIRTIFTLDRRDFSVYRTAKKLPFRLVPELRTK